MADLPESSDGTLKMSLIGFPATAKLAEQIFGPAISLAQK
jgi:hypothetical protein